VWSISINVIFIRRLRGFVLHQRTRTENCRTGHSAAAQSDNAGLTRDHRITSHSDYSRSDSGQPSQELIAGVSSLIF
jgi:hypothetical protein